ncbi:MAG TPA: RnfH family protein [Steroidobacteraceae bacterium]
MVCDTPAGVRECLLRLPAEATIAAALEAARGELGEAAANWQSAAVGIFGRVHGREHVPADGDRIEVYRALPVDPRSSRRARAAQSSMARPGRSRG